ncbi:putative Ig domain-containing protein [bacterium]|nr:putative Ig domain-containing protein [bacterium]
MKRLLPIFALLLLPLCVQAQILEKVTVKEILPTVHSRAQSDFAADAVLTNTLFFGFSYQGVSLELDLSNGKATGWLYRFYSPTLDSASFFIGVKVAIIGTQAVRLPVDTVTQYFPVSIGSTKLTEPWVDSDDALQGSKDGGAESWLQSNPDATLALCFTINNPVANKYFPQGQYYFFRYTASTDTLTCMVHASSGQPFRCFSGNAPTILTIPPTTARIGVAYSYTVNAFGDPAPSYRLETAPAGMTIDATSGKVSWTPSAGQEGKHPVTVIAENAAGSDSQSFEITVQASGGVPEITSSPVTVAVAGKQYTYQLTSTGTPAPTYSLSESPEGMLIDGGRGAIFWTPTRLHAGPHTVTVVATNSAGTDEQTYTLEVHTSPVIAPIEAQVIPYDDPFTMDPIVDAYPDPVFALNAGPDGMSIDPQTGRISWTPTQQQVGNHTVLFEAENAAGRTQRSFEIEVDASLDATGISAAPNFRLVSSYPQPASQELQLAVAARTSAAISVELFDALGRSVYRGELQANAGTTARLTIATQSLRSGMYALQLTDGTQMLQRSIIVAR